MMNDHRSRRWAIRLTMIGGILLLVGAALLAVSILLAIFPLYGTVPTLAVPGHMLYSVYGFSAFLVPLFFLFAAIVMVIPGWSPQSGFLLAGSFVPFFTIVGAEKLYAVLDLSGATSVLAPIAGGGIALTTLIAVALEYLFLLNLTDKLVSGGRFRTFPPGALLNKREKKPRHTKKTDSDSALSDTLDDYPAPLIDPTADLPEDAPAPSAFDHDSSFAKTDGVDQTTSTTHTTHSTWTILTTLSNLAAQMPSTALMILPKSLISTRLTIWMKLTVSPMNSTETA